MLIIFDHYTLHSEERMVSKYEFDGRIFFSQIGLRSTLWVIWTLDTGQYFQKG